MRGKGQFPYEKMSSVGFKWLDILEKEFDKAFVDLDLAIGELESDEPDIVYNVRQKLCTLSSCFAQLAHKAQTVFQNSAKIEAELIHMRAELVESQTKRELQKHEIHKLLVQLHANQLTDGICRIPSNDVQLIKDKLHTELQQSQSPIRHLLAAFDTSQMTGSSDNDFKFSAGAVQLTQLKLENDQLYAENAALRKTILSLNSEVYGAKLAAKYLDKELAGRIQQLQLLGREMNSGVRDKLWRQLESEILLQRHKTVVRACRRNAKVMRQKNRPVKCSKPRLKVVGTVRHVKIVRDAPHQGLGISITGGREHGVPILISELDRNGPAAGTKQLYVGDAVLQVNDIDLRNVSHTDAVNTLQNVNGTDCVLQVQYVADDTSDDSSPDDIVDSRTSLITKHPSLSSSSSSSLIPPVRKSSLPDGEKPSVKNRKKTHANNFAVKALQNMFSHHGGYKDIDTSSDSSDNDRDGLVSAGKSPSMPTISGSTRKYFNFPKKSAVAADCTATSNSSPAIMDSDQRKEKLLARYVYNFNMVNGEGVGDPDFGTPV